MTPKEQAISSLNQIRESLQSCTYIDDKKKEQLFKSIEKSMSYIPEGSCSSPEMVLAVNIMRDTYLNTVINMLNELPKF